MNYTHCVKQTKVFPIPYSWNKTQLEEDTNILFLPVDFAGKKKTSWQAVSQIFALWTWAQLQL